jgi:hypothetical protein
MMHNPGKYYEEVQNAGINLEFKGIKLKDCGKVPKISQVDSIQKLSENINNHICLTRR